MRSAFSIVFAGSLVALAGCASTPPIPTPTLQTGPNAEVTIDGLVRVDNSVMQLAYMKPNLDLIGFDKFMIDPVVVAYQKDPRGRTRSPRLGGGVDNFALRPSQMETLKSMFMEKVVEALSEGDGYEIVTEPGPDVLRLKASLIDLVVTAPTDRSGRGALFVRSYGMVSLILEVRDSQSGEILARAGDRRDPTRDTNDRLAEVSPQFMRADVARLFEFWAALVRDRFDELRAVGPTN